MSAHNYLDDLDNLLDNPKPTSATPAKPSASMVFEPEKLGDKSRPSSVPLSAAELPDEAHQASHTWAQVIEAASHALHESTQLSQETARKNIELAKEQQESIKELSDAASGWRHATRQAVQEVNATKKNIILLTVISGIIAIAGFGTTIGVMLQSRSSFVSMSNAILENVDEHQSIVSKTLTLKMDELAGTVEQMQASIDQLHASRSNATSNDAKITSETLESNPEGSAKRNTQAPIAPTSNEAMQPVETIAAPPVVLLTPVAAPAPSAILEPKQAGLLTSAPVAPANTTISAESWQQLLTQVDQLQQQLQQIEQNAQKQSQEQTKQWQQLASQVDEKLAVRLAKLPSTTADIAKTPNSVTAVVDTKPIMEQLSRLRQEMAELRLLQQSLKEQIGQVKQTVSESANKPYQYRLPQDNERYPR